MIAANGGVADDQIRSVGQRVAVGHNQPPAKDRRPALERVRAGKLKRSAPSFAIAPVPLRAPESVSWSLLAGTTMSAPSIVSDRADWPAPVMLPAEISKLVAAGLAVLEMTSAPP